MLRLTPQKKPTIPHPVSKKSAKLNNIENSPQPGFNTKGYFSSQQPYAEDYLKAKHQVFNKYRSKDNELVFIDPSLTKTSDLLQRGMLKPINRISNEPLNGERVVGNFLKNYMHRKEKKEQFEDEKYFGKRKESIGIFGAQFNPSISAVKSHRPSTKSMFSRVSTSRSICSNKEN